jgi:hypothetical protein
MEVLHQIGRTDVARLGATVADSRFLLSYDETAYRNHFRSKRESFLVTGNYIDFKTFYSPLGIVGDMMSKIEAVVVNKIPETESKGSKKSLLKGLKEIENCISADIIVVLNSNIVLEQFDFLSSDTNYKIAFPVLNVYRHGVHRFKIIKKLADENRLDIRTEYYLYGLTNPAELSLYRNKLSSSVNSTLKAVITDKCYVDSAYLVNYSPSVGSPVHIPGPLEQGYEWEVQYVTFKLNDERMKSFANGNGGQEILESYETGELSWIM